MRRAGKKKAGASAASQKRSSGAGNRKQDGASMAAAAESAGQETPITQYIFTFELIRHYPTVRSFIVKQPLKRSFKDTMSELFGGNKKGVYRI
jgi:hypothetical protein